MIKLVKNEFFIYCKETRIESNRSFYGSFSLGPFDSGQSITIANALRRTLLSELKGLAITSAEIEGAFHEYSTLPGVRDSILDILLNLKDIVLKTENYGNKKRGTSYATTFKKTQIGYLKTRGPGIVTASELKLPPGIQCVDPEQYIATLSEEGILNIKLMINEGKNYVLQNSYSPNSNANSYNSNSEKPVGGKKESFLGKELLGQNLALAKQAASLKKVVNNQKTTKLLPSIVNSGYKSGKKIEVASYGKQTAGFKTYINFKRRRLWLHKRNLFKTSSFFLGNSPITKNFSSNKGVKALNINKEFKTLLVLPKKEFFLCKQKIIKPGLMLPVLTMVRKILLRSTRKTTQSGTHLGSLSQENLDRELQKKANLFSFLLIKKGNLRTGVKSFFENTQKYKNNLPTPNQGSNFISLNSHQELREGGAITATKAVSLVIDAVFMPVNKVNYIIETNEQSVMSSSFKEKTSSNTRPSPFLGYGQSKSNPLPIFTPRHGEQFVDNKLSLPDYFGFARQSESFSFLSKLPLIDKNKEERASDEELRQHGLYKNMACSPKDDSNSAVSQKKILFKNGEFYFSKKKILPLPFPIYRSKGVFFFLNNFNKNKSQQGSYFVRLKKRVASEIRIRIRRASSSDSESTSSFFVRNNIIMFRKKNNYILSQQLRFLKSCVGSQSFLPFTERKKNNSSPSYPPSFFSVSSSGEQERVSRQVPYPISNERRKKVFLKSTAAQNTKIIGTQFNKSTNTNILDFSLPQSLPRDLDGSSLQNPEKGLFKNKMRLSDNQTKTPLKNNIILEIWTNGSIHPRQALYEACKNLLSLFSKLEKATPLAFPQRTLNIS